MQILSKQINLFWIAVSFFTRIPVPKSVDYSEQLLNRASRYFPVVGLFIGIITAFCYWAASIVLPENVALILSMLCGILLTGCFHEDGLADVADGFGGGWTVEQKLNIMKDSRLGTYGAAALWFSLTLKFVLLSQLSFVVIALIVSHTLSRGIAVLLIQALPYVQLDKASKVKPLAQKLSVNDIAVIATFCVCAFYLLGTLSALLIPALLCTFIALFLWLKRQIGGFTGDALGAAQQISESICYLTLLIAEMHFHKLIPNWFFQFH